MGTFMGHVLPGSFFIIFFGLFFFNSILRFCKCRRNHKPFTSTLKIPDAFFFWRFKEWPTESVIRLVLIVVAFSLEIYTGFRNGKFVNIGNAHHATMYTTFAMIDVVILLRHCIKQVPANAEFVMLSFAFMIEGVLFSNHLHGRTRLDVTLHTLLVYVIFACALMSLVIVKYSHNILLFLTQMYLVILQGTWFLQVGFILYNPVPESKPWDTDDHDAMMWVPLLFAWHCIGILVVMSMVAGLIICCKWREYTGSGNGMVSLLHNGVIKDYMKVKMNDEMYESDVELETKVP